MVQTSEPKPIRAARHPASAVAAAVVAALVLVAPAPAQAFNKSFAAGSLIIPAQMEYQTDCGMTSAYGLVYTLLYKNADLVKAGKKAISIYWVIDPRKLSHHRCDTSTDALPSYATFNENDGCDLAIQSAAGQPVSLLATDNATVVAPFNVYSTSYDKAKGMSSRTSPSPNTPIDSSKKVVKYSGSFWVIDAADRAVALELMRSDPLVHKFRDGGRCSSIPVATAGSHHVEIHSANIGFTAPIARIINVKPPLIALLDAGAVTILQQYLRNAGLADMPDAGGTPLDHGIIYDTLDPVTDFVSTPTYPLGAINMPDPTDATTAAEARRFYQVLWAPHWESVSQSTQPREGDPGDDQRGDGKWTHWDPLTGTYDDPITNALKNIGAFANTGNGVFAECASIESFEGSYDQGDPSCSGVSQCTCSDATSCTVGDVQPLSCGAGYTAACGACYQCGAGYTLDASVCNEVKCVAPINTCSAGYTYACGGCYACRTGYTLDSSRCSQVICRDGGRTRTPMTSALNSGALTTVAGGCATGFAQSCVPATGSIDMTGNDATHFQVTNRLQKNGLGESFSGPDCTDGQIAAGTKYKMPAVTDDCLDFHPATGGPASIFSQKGNFNYTGTSGHIHQYKPPAKVGSYYRPGVTFFATSRNTLRPDRDGWDFTSATHKDNDPSKGMIVYLAGHSYQNDVAGNRIVLNTMLNLGFSDDGVEISRSEPVGYVTRNASGAIASQTVFQGTYIQRPPPGPFQDWVNYNSAVPRAWKFPYTDGHLRAYALTDISTSKQDFRSNSLWDAATRLPLPQNRRVYTVLGGRGRVGWQALELKHTETDPAGSCKSSRTDATGGKICDLSWELAACATAGVTQFQLSAGDPAGAAKKNLGMFVQQVRGHCSAHDKVTKDPIYVPTDDQCDDLKQQKNRAKLGGIDHSSPAIVGPSGYIKDQKVGTATIRWSTRPVVAYAGGRDGALHAFYVSGDTSWGAEGQALPAGVQPGQELWAFVPPVQLCGLSTNTAMVDGAVNVVDVFGKFPRDANDDGVIDWSSAAERPTGLRTWRTILLASVGEGGSELFALDVTNPLKPVLLWHLAGPLDKDDQYWDVAAAQWRAMDKTKQATYANKWFNWDDGIATTDHIPTPYNTKNATTLDRIKTGRYDYKNMGLSLGTAVGMLWEGNTFKYVVWLTSSTADWTDPATPLGFKGIEVYAIDLVTGEKQWQWQNRYTKVNADGNVIADNGSPGRPALLDTNYDGVVERVYAGDLEGRMWELDAADGKNHNYLKAEGSPAYVSLPFFGTRPMEGTGVPADILADFTRTSGGLAQQPLTSPIGVGRMLQVPTALEPYLKDRMAAAQGTMGVDWSIAPFQKGHLLVVPAYPEVQVVAYKDPVTQAVVTKSVDTRERKIDVSGNPALLDRGVLLDAARWDIPLKLGERVFGMPKIVGNDIIVNTSFGGFGGDIAETYLDAGSTLRITASAGTQVEAIGKAFGGALIMGDTIVVGSASGMVRIPPTAGTPLKESVETRARNRVTPTNFGTWEQLSKEPLQ